MWIRDLVHHRNVFTNTFLIGKIFLPMIYLLCSVKAMCHIFPSTIQGVFVSLRNFYITIDSLCSKIMSNQSISYS